MDPVIVVTAAEYNAATDRVNSALKTLKRELVSLRHQDVTLLKQLIHINDTIRTLSSDTKCTKNRLRHTKSQPVRLTASFSASSTKPCSKWRAPLVRQRSVPRHCDVVPEENDDSCSSSDESSLDESYGSVTSFSDLNDSTNSISSTVPVFASPSSRKRYESAKVPVLSRDSESSTEDSNYEEILKRNVKLWKVTKAHIEERDTVFEEDSEGETIENE